MGPRFCDRLRLNFSKLLRDAAFTADRGLKSDLFRGSWLSKPAVQVLQKVLI